MHSGPSYFAELTIVEIVIYFSAGLSTITLCANRDEGSGEILMRRAMRNAMSVPSAEGRVLRAPSRFSQVSLSGVRRAKSLYPYIRIFSSEEG
jgi:hypothetical protein